MYSSYVAPWGLSLVLVRRRPDLASEDRLADRGVEQHQRQDEEARAQNMKARLEGGAAASSIMIEKVIM